MANGSRPLSRTPRPARTPVPARRGDRGATASPWMEAEAMRWGHLISRSANSGVSARARVISSKSSVTGMMASSNTGPRAMMSPRGSVTIEPPANALPPSKPTS